MDFIHFYLLTFFYLDNYYCFRSFRYKIYYYKTIFTNFNTIQLGFDQIFLTPSGHKITTTLSAERNRSSARHASDLRQRSDQKKRRTRGCRGRIWVSSCVRLIYLRGVGGDDDSSRLRARQPPSAAESIRSGRCVG